MTEIPAFCYILHGHINKIYTSAFDRARAIVGVSVHELGHARGIEGDDPNLSPSHGPAGSTRTDRCIMHAVTDLTNSGACRYYEAHAAYLSGISW
jgi:hypothetical protein